MQIRSEGLREIHSFPISVFEINYIVHRGESKLNGKQWARSLELTSLQGTCIRTELGGSGGERRGALNSSLDQEEIILLTLVLIELNFLLWLNLPS